MVLQILPVQSVNGLTRLSRSTRRGRYSRKCKTVDLKPKKLIGATWKRVGGLSKPSKMPGYGWGISATLCNIGSKLALIPGTICNGCYNFEGRYIMANVVEAHKRRLHSYYNNPDWVDDMIFLIGAKLKKKSKKDRYFRWFDAGDTQDANEPPECSERMFDKIVAIARALPWVNFWMPTKEWSVVDTWIQKNGEPPSNLTVRLSAYRVNFPGPVSLAKRLGLPISEVTTHKADVTCPAYRQGGMCSGRKFGGIDCRACWNKAVFIVRYPKHGRVKRHLKRVKGTVSRSTSPCSK